MAQTVNREVIRGFEEQKTKGVSPWMLSLQQELGSQRPAPRWSYTVQDFVFELIDGDQSLWIVARFPSGGEVALRAAYRPYNRITIEETRSLNTGVENADEHGRGIRLSSVTGE